MRPSLKVPAPFEAELTKAVLARLQASRHVLVMDFRGCRGDREIEARLELYAMTVEAMPFGLVVWQTEVEARFTRGGKYAPGGCPGQADLHILCKPTGREVWLEGKRNDGKAKQSKKQVSFERIVTSCGADYRIYRTVEDVLDVASELLCGLEPKAACGRCNDGDRMCDCGAPGGYQ